MSFQALGEAVDIVAGQHIEASLYSSEPVGSAYLTGPADFGETRPHVTKWTSAPKVFAKASDVLVTVKGAGVGKSNLGCDAAIGRQIMALRPKQEKILQSYLFHFIRHKEQRIAGLADGATVPGIGKADLANLQISLPSIEEQKRIAAILDKADQLRQKRRQAIALLDSLTQSIFLEMFEDPAQPKEVQWTAKPLADLVEEFRYGTSEKSQPTGYPVLRIPNVVGGSISLSDLKYVPMDHKELARLRLQEGDVLFVRTNGNKDYVGRSAVVTSEIEKQAGQPLSDFIYASYLIRARVKRNILNSHFLQAFLSGPSGRKMLLERAKTSAGQYNINTEGLGSLRIPLPPIERQLAFEKQIAEINSKMALVSSQITALESLFSSLQHRAFSGQL